MRPTAIPMKHYVHLNTMAEILKVRDFESLCPTCHQVRPNNYSFAPFTRQGCNRNNPNCHALKRPEGGKKWKDPLAQKPIKGYTKPKSSNALFMHSRHIQEHKCTECHPDIVTSKRVTHAAIATAEMCARCHKAEAEKH
jgi:c(7)-type cytochrome triheme protein